MWSFLTYISQLILSVFQSKYKYIVFFFFLLLYRIEFMPDMGGGFSKLLQTVALFAIILYIFYYCPQIATISFRSTTDSISSCLLLYFFAIISTAWAYVPTFALFLSVQNVVLILLFVWFFSLFSTFDSLERAFLMVCVTLQLFQLFCTRLSSPSLFVHFLPGASVAAFTLSYCAGEYMNMKEKNGIRLQLFKYVAIISAFNLVTCTSGGANAAVVCAIGASMFFGDKKVYAFLLVILGFFLFFNQQFVDDIILTLMPGKNMETIQSGNGREAIWEAILESASTRPVYGWGFACAERTVSDVIRGQILNDAHNSYIGIYGGLGYIGCALLGYHLVRMILDIFPFIKYPGYLGLFSLFVCACVNMYSYGFLSGKACSNTMVYFMLVALTFHYRRVLSK